MPVNLTDFIIRQPRVASINHKKTLPPSTSGSYTLFNAFSVKYNGSGASAVLYLNAKRLLVIVNQDRSHADNLNFSLVGKQLQDVVDAINANANFTAVLQGSGTDRALIEGKIKQDIKTAAAQIRYAKTAEYLIEAENTAKLGTASVQWVKNDFAYQPIDFNWQIKAGESFDVTGLLTPNSGITAIENGANLVLAQNPDNAEFDIAKLKTATNETLVKNAGSNVQFINMSVLKRIVAGTLSLIINEAPAIEDVHYTVSIPDTRINFLRSISNEVHTLTDDARYIDLNTQGIGGILSASISLLLDANPLTPFVDFVPQAATQYQNKDMCSGRIYFTQTYTDDLIAEYALTSEGALISNDIVIKKNGVAISPDEYILVYEAGFLNVNTPLFPGDVLTASYRSQQYGPITDEILAGIPATVTNGVADTFTITSGSNDTLVIKADGVTETITLPIGTNVSFNDIIAAYNAQAARSFAAKNVTGDRLIIASKTAGASSTIEVLAANANGTLALNTGATSTGSGAAGGEFAFDLVNAPVEVNTFKVPKGGDTFYIREANVATNYQPNTLIQVNNDLYLVDSVSTSNYPVLFTNAGPFRISSGINDKFTIEVDGVERNITLTSGDRTTQDIADDINLIVNIASTVTFNGKEVIKLRSPTAGIGGMLRVGDGNANLMLGLTNGQNDSGLTDTIVKVQSPFPNPYENPTLRTTKKPVTFVSESAAPEKSPSGVSTVEFNGVNVTEHYKPNTVIKINSFLYNVLNARFENGKTVVQLTSKLQSPIYPIDTVQYTARPVFTEGETTLSFQSEPILDLPITIKDNNILLISGTDYTVNENGTITLADSRKLSASSKIEATYTVFSSAPAGSEIRVSYRFFSSLNEGSLVTASYQFISPDQFFFDVVYENDLSEKILDRIKSETDSLTNPSSSGYTSSTGGDQANSDSGNETPKLGEYKYRYEDTIGKKYGDFFSRRIQAFTDERSCYNGWKVGANDGPVTESDIQAVINTSSRLYPQGYTASKPKRVPAFDGLNQNDDGSTTGGVESSIDATIFINSELTNISNETTYINQMLAIPTGGSASIIGSTSITSVTFYNGTGINPANNVLNIKVNNVAYTISFAASGSGTITSQSSIISSINSVVNCASASGSNLKLSATLAVEVLSGSANSVLGLSVGSVATRKGSTAYSNWLTAVSTEQSKQQSTIDLLTAILPQLEIIMEEWLSPYTQAFDDAKSWKVIVQQFIDDTTASKAQNATDYTMDVNYDGLLTNRRDVTNVARTAQINSFLTQVATRLTQISNALINEKLFDTRYAWLAFRADRGLGTVPAIKRMVDAQTSSNSQIQLNTTLTSSA